MRLAILTLIVALAGPAAAQERAFVQIEAHPQQAEAAERAEAYEAIVTDINGFRLGSGWYAIALGPYAPGEARATLGRLRSEGLIPRDSYISDGDVYRERFWPAATDAELDDAPEDAAVNDALRAALESVSRTEPRAEAAPAPSTTRPPEEDVRAARRSEAALDRTARMDLQRAMQWFGTYGGAIDGAIGRGTRAAMGDWQAGAGYDATGVLTTRQRAQLLSDWRAAQAELGLEPLRQEAAGIALVAPMGLVTFDRIEAPFVHYAPKDDSGVRLSLISQAGDRGTLHGLYEILQTLDLVPPEGDRSSSDDAFRITGLAPDRTTQVEARLIDGHVVGYLLSWTEAQDALAARALPEMSRTLASIGPALPAEAGFDAAAQRLDMVSGLEVRQPLRSAAGFWIDGDGTVLTAAANVTSCGRVTLDGRHEATVTRAQDGVAVLAPRAPLAPVQVAALASEEGRLGSPVSVAGFPYGGVLDDATVSLGTLEDVRGLSGEDALLRLSLRTRDGDVGGPVLDETGRVAGMLLPAPVEGDRVLPDDVAFALKSTRLAEILAPAPDPAPLAGPGTRLTARDLAARAAGLTVRVECWE